ncbi:MULTISPECIES: HypC/HybG/HupF family hydrogenase formation chaperone [Aminobacterium]|jgi:hydrogenase expression/formation protein HypC|uniref:Hydrogenase assembly chaperone hypC/hupF n=1 Tax=Aminobacterium colombiense (strain DSM 12261 / ALA-1) TaxID=572547 RepID=D5EG36_AMICL|nr:MULTISPECIES: HypC/HybG/HupF family hydrogenase formation chaperone [Aminobacterium]MDD2378922.1 HypC/HybG/HupF family hydrogenase formation chaperone [Aminobacterium colombiense]ADE57518.1 hydrogenase assembly chaperone hypC/hupF [Aminobacterium colombiense DSM 12261]MDD3767719.1 HypC/HybG/HupF family hydrogenase formation chaperone [Aminobacterium colombiense]MDD4265121.1 HypC/HybG/HupF family hydrogenase formation chaperone [Aminobacterium colombiense]MDD4585698.1 HypC/HybG/HupF family h
MCLAVPHTIERILDHNTVLATAGSVQVEVRVDLIDSADIGDTVLVHAGFAIEKLEENDSIELQALWNEIHLYSEKSHVTL